MKQLDPANLGTEAVRQALDALAPEHATGFNRVFGTPGETYPSAPNYHVEGTIEQVVANQNELIQEVAALKQRPFGG